MLKRTCVLTLILLAVLGSLFADVPRTLYVINEAGETLSKMDMDTGAIRQNIVSIGQVPNQVAVHNDLIYVVNSGTDDIMVIDPRHDSQVVRTIALPEGSNPWAMGFVGAGKAYVTNQVAGTVSVIDLDAGVVTGEIVVGTAPQGLLVDGNRVFVANTGMRGWSDYGQASVTIIDALADTVTHTLNVPTNAQDFAMDSWGNVHVLCSGDYATQSGKVAVINLYTGPSWNTPAVVDTVEFGWIDPATTTFAPGDLVITQDDKAYCVAWGDGEHGFICSYDAISRNVLHAASDPILVGPNVSQLLYDAQEDVLWIPTMTVWGGDGAIQKFDTAADSVVWVSGVMGSGSKSLAILEPILDSSPGADAVTSFIPGTGAGFGQNFFPNNVLGNPDPDPSVNENSPSSKPSEILSLGHGGEIVLEFSDNVIVDGDGPDFTVFENAFIMFGTTDSFIEAGIVSVSQDGETFVEFPYDTATFAGLAGVTPTKDTQNSTNPALSGGDQFDLADVGLTQVKFVKITDLGDIKKEGATNGDFDLDAVVAIHSQPASSPVRENEAVPAGFRLAQNYPNPFNPETVIGFTLDKAANVRLEIYNMLGQSVKTLVSGKRAAGQYQVQWNGLDRRGRRAGSGVYFCKLTAGSRMQIRKMTLVR